MKILIAGLGLMGGAYAYKLKNKNHIIYGYDIDNKSIKFAKENGYIDDGSINPIEFIKSSDLIIIALYPKNILSFLNEYKSYFNENQIITDIAGIKKFVYEAEKISYPASYISHHPMAGKEKVGIKSSNLVSFNGANFLITTTDNTNLDKIKIIENLGLELGFSNITKIDVNAHDEFIAFTSQLTHAIAVSLINCVNDDLTKLTTGDSFRDLTRIAKINESLWVDLFLGNKDNLLSKIDLFMDSLNDLKDAIINDDSEKLKELFKKSTSIREEMDVR